MSDREQDLEILSTKLNYLAKEDPKKFKVTFINTFLDVLNVYIDQAVRKYNLPPRDKSNMHFGDAARDNDAESYYGRRRAEVLDADHLDYEIYTIKMEWLSRAGWEFEDAYIDCYMEDYYEEVDKGIDYLGDIILNPDAYLEEKRKEAHACFSEGMIDAASGNTRSNDALDDWYDEDLDQGQGMYLSDGMYLREDGTIYATK